MVPHRAKAGLFGRSSILFRPHTPAMNGKFGGVAGYRPRVRADYYRCVYRHSRSCPRQGQYRGPGAGTQGGLSTQDNVTGSQGTMGLAVGIYPWSVSAVDIGPAWVAASSRHICRRITWRSQAWAGPASVRTCQIMPWVKPGHLQRDRDGHQRQHDPKG